MADVFGRQDQVLLGGLSSDSMFMSWPELAAIGGGLGMLIQRVGLDYQQPIRRIFEIGPGVIPFGNGFSSADICDDPVAGQIGAEVCAFRTQPTYYIIGRPEGNLQFGRFVGPQVLGQCFYRKYGSACSPNVISISGKAGCSATDMSASRMTWAMNGVVVRGLNMNVDGQELVMQEGVSCMFAGLNITIDGQEPICDSSLAG